MRFKLLIMVLVLVPLLGCAAIPKKQEETMDEIPQQFLGYWAPSRAASVAGLHIHADGRINQVNNTNGDLIEAYFYKFIHSADPNTIYVMVKSAKYPKYIHYYSYKIEYFDRNYETCTILKEYDQFQTNIDWNNFNQAKEMIRVKEIFEDKKFPISYTMRYISCPY